MSTRDHNEGDPHLTERADIGEPGGPHTKTPAPGTHEARLAALEDRMNGLENWRDQQDAQPNVGNSRVEG